MFGLYRTMLAIWVMAYHLLDIPIVGTYAVFSFFVLSGFLMTTIMHDSYGHNMQGIKKYAENRFLRLYPMYWASAILSIAIIIFSSADYSFEYKDCLAIPTTVPTALYNATMIFPRIIPYFVSPRLSPPTWALTVEIFFYICIGLGLSKSRKLTITWVFATLLYYIYSYAAGLGEPYRYAFIFGASLPFSFGSLLYFEKERLFEQLKSINMSSPTMWLALYIANAIAFSYYGYTHNTGGNIMIADLGKYINLILSIIVVASLYYKGHELFDKKTDKKIGDYSYPIYLIHWQSGLLASSLLYATPSRGLNIHGLISFLFAIIIVFIVSSLFIMLIDKNVNTLRDRIRKRAV